MTYPKWCELRQSSGDPVCFQPVVGLVEAWSGDSDGWNRHVLTLFICEEHYEMVLPYHELGKANVYRLEEVS